jgi:hypothetical protein
MLITVLWGHVGDDDVIVPLSLIDDEASHAPTTHKNIVGLRVLC